MIIDHTTNVRTNLTGSVEFSVSDDSAKIFSFLSNFLYKDKERSVMTELCSNALDAHKMVNKENVPIKVNLPTELQKEFRVRDYGPGLTEDQVYQFLTKYGSSSKTNSNDYIGGFGIGSKSPAAVTDTWIINSHNGGFETSYLIHVNDRGIPSINKLFTKPSTETGLEVIVPTKTIKPWIDAAHKVFEYYDVQPELKGISYSLPKSTFVHQLNGLIMFKEKSSKRANYGYYSTGFALMNRRAYELDLFKLDIKSLFNDDFYIPFGTAELSVSLSREDLQYDSHTIKSIKQRFADIKAALIVLWKQEVSSKKDIFEYQLAASKFRETYRVSGDGCVDIATFLNDKRAELVDFFHLNNFTIELNAENLSAQYCDAEECKSLKVNRYGVGMHHARVITKGYAKPTKYLSFSCKDKESLAFVLRDTKDSPSRVKRAIGNGDLPNAIILDKSWYDLIPSCFKKVVASSLEKVNNERIKKEKVVSELFQLTGSRFSRIEEKNIDTSCEWVYIRMTNANTISSIVNKEDYEFIKTFTFNGVGPEVVFLKPTSAAPKWAITPMEWLKKENDRFCLKKDEIIKAHKFNKLKNINKFSLLGKMFEVPELFRAIPAGSVAGNILAEINSFRASPPDLTLLKEFNILYKCVKMLSGKIANVNSFEIEYNYQEQMIEAYPMLKFVGEGYVSDDRIQTIVEYIKLCGK